MTTRTKTVKEAINTNLKVIVATWLFDLAESAK
jgi:hypothetical protein